MFWDSYLRHRDVDVRTKDGVRIQGRWDSMISVMRDVKVSENTPDHYGAIGTEYSEVLVKLH